MTMSNRERFRDDGLVGTVDAEELDEPDVQERRAYGASDEPPVLTRIRDIFEEAKAKISRMPGGQTHGCEVTTAPSFPAYRPPLPGEREEDPFQHLSQGFVRIPSASSYPETEQVPPEFEEVTAGSRADQQSSMHYTRPDSPARMTYRDHHQHAEHRQRSRSHHGHRHHRLSPELHPVSPAYHPHRRDQMSQGPGSGGATSSPPPLIPSRRSQHQDSCSDADRLSSPPQSPQLASSPGLSRGAVYAFPAGGRTVAQSATRPTQHYAISSPGPVQVHHGTYFTAYSPMVQHHQQPPALPVQYVMPPQPDSAANSVPPALPPQPQPQPQPPMPLRAQAYRPMCPNPIGVQPCAPHLPRRIKTGEELCRALQGMPLERRNEFRAKILDEPQRRIPRATTTALPPKQNLSSVVAHMKGHGRLPEGMSTRGQQIQLWQFLFELLTTGPQYSDIIAWTKDQRGEFKLLQPEGVAKLWGGRKNKPGMNYDKMSRAMRYYYEKGVMEKIPGQRYCYCFSETILQTLACFKPGQMTPVARREQEKIPWEDIIIRKTTNPGTGLTVDGDEVDICYSEDDSGGSGECTDSGHGMDAWPEPEPPHVAQSRRRSLNRDERRSAGHPYSPAGHRTRRSGSSMSPPVMDMQHIAAGIVTPTPVVPQYAPAAAPAHLYGVPSGGRLIYAAAPAGHVVPNAGHIVTPVPLLHKPIQVFFS